MFKGHLGQFAPQESHLSSLSFRLLVSSIKVKISNQITENNCFIEILHTIMSALLIQTGCIPQYIPQLICFTSQVEHPTLNTPCDNP